MVKIDERKMCNFSKRKEMQRNKWQTQEKLKKKLRVTFVLYISFKLVNILCNFLNI